MGVGRLPISSCPGYFPRTLCRNAFLSWFSSVVAGQDRTLPGSVHPLHSFRHPFLRVAWGTTEIPGQDPTDVGRGEQRGGPKISFHGGPRGQGRQGFPRLPFPHPSVTHRGPGASAVNIFPRPAALTARTPAATGLSL